jgi:ABC-type transporter Mla subunit MlaD
MNKQTKRIRTNRIKKKTRKYYGGSSSEVNDKSKGIFDIFGDKLTDYSGKAFSYVKDKGLRLAGLQSIKQSDTTNSTPEKNETSEAVSEIVTNVKNVVDKGSSAVLDNINNMLATPAVSESLNEAAEQTVKVGEKLLGNFNETVSSPKMKEETKEALENISDYTSIVVDAIDEPLDKAIDSLNKSGTKAISGLGSGAVKVGTDMLAAVPGFGAIIELGKVANDASAAIGDVVEAASDATSTIAKVVDQTSKNIDTGLDKLEDKKKSLNELNKDGLNVSNRVNKSIDQFENPVKSVPVLKGGRKTRRKLLKRKGKKKSVRFAI